MCRKGIGLIVWGLVLGLAQATPAAWDPLTDPNLIAWWKCDEGQGSVVADSSPNHHDGTFVDGPPSWTVGFRGSGSGIRLVNPTLVEVPAMGLTLSQATMAGWVLPNGAQVNWASFIMHRGPGPANGFNMVADRHLAYHWGGAQNTWSYRGEAYYSTTEWTHCAVTVEPTKATFYVNGVQAAVNTVGHPPAVWDGPIWLGGDRSYTDGTRRMNGSLDEVIFFSRALTAAQVKALIPPYVKARNPSPGDGATGVSIPMLTWTPGELSVLEDVYVGTTGELTGADRVASRQSIYLKFWYPQTAPLAPGQKYYWRVDGIDQAGNVYKGDVWNFTLVPVKAWAPVPANGAGYQSVDADLAWSPTQTAVSHEVYFGTSREDVANGAVSVSKGTVQLAAMELPPLTLGTTYYWRVDEIDGSNKKTIGEVWSFATRPGMAKTDNLVGWWKLDDENSGTAVDYSGWDQDGTLLGNPKWVDGCQGGAMEFDGVDDYVDTHYATDLATWTMCTWVTSPLPPGATSPTGPMHREKNFQINWNHSTAADRGAAGLRVGGTWHFASFGNLAANTWYHLAATYDGVALVTYLNGELVTTNATPEGPADAETGTLTFGKHSTAANFFRGTVDDVRLYDRVLTQDEIKQTMRGDPLLAWDPRPKLGLTVDIRDLETLSWSAGETGVEHDVYVGKDKAAVRNADATSPEYRGRQADTSWATSGVVEFGGGAYFWRVDEVEADGTTVHKGTIWSFTVPDFLLVDDFESYTNDSPNRIFQTWIDGWGFSEDEFFPAGHPGNGTSSAVGHDIWTAGTSYTTIVETSVVHPGSKQSMPFDYNNINNPYYSETDRTWTAAQDWTLHGVDTLSLWFRGYPVGFVDKGDGAFIVGASGGDIYGTADDFRFVYKRLSGDGSITAQVESIANSHAYAKAGVMIRATLDAGSTYAIVAVSPGNGTTFEYRAMADSAAASAAAWTGGAIKAPYWVRLIRTGDLFKAETSADGKAWTVLGTEQTILMGTSVYIGLPVTSHIATATTTAEFSNVATTGVGVTGAWQQIWIGDDRDLTNAAGNLYVAIQDSSNKTVVVNHPDPNGVLTATWTEWQIPLTQFAGANPKAVKKVFIGVGDRKAPQPGGHGSLYLDDIRVIKP